MADKQQAHTAGPWTIDAGGDIVAPIQHDVFIEQLIASFGDCSQSTDELAANKHIIAAAPDMLKALEMVRDADNDCIADGLPRWCTDSARTTIDAAICKAKGETA